MGTTHKTTHSEIAIGHIQNYSEFYLNRERREVNIFPLPLPHLIGLSLIGHTGHCYANCVKHARISPLEIHLSQHH